MELFWYGVLGALFAAYFALGGLDYGVGLLLSTSTRERRKRLMLNAVGPRFLGNEVWIVAVAGVLIAAFPRLEGELFGAVYPLLVTLVLALLAVNAAVQLRSRGKTRRGFDTVIVVASAVLAVGWGVLLGNLLTGRPVHADGHVASYSGILGWYPLLTGTVTAALFVAHGAAFLAWRLDDPRHAALLRRLAVAAAVLTGLAVVGAYTTSDAASPVAGTAVALAIPACLAVAVRLAHRGRAGLAVVFTALAAALPVVATGVALYPAVLMSTVDPAGTVTVAGGAAGDDALSLLAVVAAPLLPVLAAAQVACWWLFRHRNDARVPMYW